MRFAAFRKTHGIIEIEEQGKALINTIATLRAEIVETEVAVAVLRETVNATNPELLRFERTLSALEGQYQSLLQRSEQQAGSMQVLPAMQDVPGLALEILPVVPRSDRTGSYLRKPCSLSMIFKS